jgi:hypothetical protein
MTTVRLTDAEREALEDAVLDHQKEVLDYGTREGCSCGEYRWTGKHAMDGAVAAVEQIIARRLDAQRAWHGHPDTTTRSEA